jgi:hypothetical protein
MQVGCRSDFYSYMASIPPHCFPPNFVLVIAIALYSNDTTIPIPVHIVQDLVRCRFLVSDSILILCMELRRQGETRVRISDVLAWLWVALAWLWLCWP